MNNPLRTSPLHTLFGATCIALAALASTACIDDAAIPTAVNSRLMENKDLAGTSISVETLKGTVMLSGFAKSGEEKLKDENLARPVEGVASIKNEIAIRS